jgi:hypothetical protein
MARGIRPQKPGIGLAAAACATMLPAMFLVSEADTAANIEHRNRDDAETTRGSRHGFDWVLQWFRSLFFESSE